MTKTIKEIYGDNVVALVGIITKSQNRLFTIRERNGVIFPKKEFEIIVDGSLKDLCEEFKINWDGA